MNLLVIFHGLLRGGAQISTLEFLKLLRFIESDINIRIVICQNSDKGLIKDLMNMSYVIVNVPCKQKLNYPEMSIELAYKDINWADIVWITDEIYLVAPRIKRVRRIPVIAHLHSYALLCPWWGLLYGMRDVCNGCSFGRIVRCKQLFNEELIKLGILDPLKGNIYKFLDFIKGPADYTKFRMLLRDVIESIDVFIAVSRFVEGVYRRLLGSDELVKTIYNPVTTPLEFLSSNPEATEGSRDNVILYASGSNPVKGPHLALEALKILAEEGHKIKMIMTGCKGSWVETYAKRVGVSEYVEFVDRMPPEQFYKLMSRAKAVVMPSIWPEPFGRVPVEANRLGTPAVVTNRGGLPETVIDGKTGFVVEPTPEALARVLSRYLSGNSVNAAEITSLSLKHIEPEKSVKDLLNLLYRFVG